MYVTDMTKPPELMVLELFNEGNGTSFTPETLKVHRDPVVTADGNHGNSVLTLEDLSGDFDYPTIPMRYNRIDLETLFSLVAIHLREADIVNENRELVNDLILSEITRKYGLNASSTDFQIAHIGDTIDEVYLGYGTEWKNTVVRTHVSQNTLDPAAKCIAPFHMWGGIRSFITKKEITITGTEMRIQVAVDASCEVWIDGVQKWITSGYETLNEKTITGLTPGQHTVAFVTHNVNNEGFIAFSIFDAGQAISHSDVNWLAKELLEGTPIPDEVGGLENFINTFVSESYQFVARPDNPAYTGRVPVNFLASLFTRIQNKTLNGFLPTNVILAPQPGEYGALSDAITITDIEPYAEPGFYIDGKALLDLMTWRTDFTESTSLFVLDGSNELLYRDDINVVLADQGIPPIPAGTTAEIRPVDPAQGDNGNFTNVMVTEVVNTGVANGRYYFHY